ncbi:hypothetical protein BSF42_30250 [Flavobacterium sp. ACN6]|nr:hypothetical protein BSF42_30250 [Flavobacterium sp. ACN6]
MCFFVLFEKNTNRFKKVKNITANQNLIYLCVLKRKRFLKLKIGSENGKIKSNYLKIYFKYGTKNK